MKIITRITTFIFVVLTCASASAQVLFEDVTEQAGPFHIGESWGAAWGDFNGDNCPDILVDNHRHKNSLWRNNCEGKFHDVMLTFDIDRVFISETQQDTHGSSFADIDNDGDQDIFSTRSSEGSRGQLFINAGGYGDEQGSVYGFDDCRAGRLGSFFDYDNDGYLDVFCSNNGATIVYKGDAGARFVRDDSVIESTGACQRNNYTQFANFYTPSSGMDMSCSPAGTIPDRLYDMTTLPFTNVTSINSPNISNVSDTIFADFDNDLDVDLFALKNATRPSGASLIGTDKIESWIIVDKKAGEVFTQKGFRFTASGTVTLTDIEISRVSEANLRFNIFVGAAGNNPGTIPIVLDPNDATNHGLIDLESAGFYIGYDPATQQWTGLLRSVEGHKDGYFTFEGTNLSEPQMINLDVRDLPSTPRMHGNNNGTLSPSNGLGLNEPISCGSIAAGDLDNDMDIDLYLACRTGVKNLENIVYWNDGDGTFTRGLNHGGEGPVGAGLDSGVGVAESVVIGDYDTDGFLDLFVTNGNLLAPEFIGGPDVLIRNLGGNGNHWIELDLVGTTSNRDAVGATVKATAGGITQMREQNGGYHRWSQDHTRIHFGLAANTSVDITVDWPDGSTDSYTNIAADSLYKVNQGGSIVAASVGPMVDFPAPVPGDECGAPIIDSSSSRALFLYKDCGTGLWQLRASVGNSPTDVTYSGSLTSSQSITNVLAFNLEATDSLNQTSGEEIDYSFTMNRDQVDGFEFRLSPGASSCFSMDTPDDIPVFLGDGYHLPTLPFSLETLGSCLSVTASDLTVSEAVGVAQIDVSLLNTSNQLITVDYQTANGSASAGSDYTAQSGTLTFNPGDSVKSISIPVIDDTNSESDEAFTVNFTNVSSLASLATSSITVTIEDNDSAQSSCGDPAINAATDRALFIWKDCAGNGDWHVVGTAGGGTFISYEGNIATDQTFSNIEPVSIEASDVLGLSDPKVIDFKLGMGNIWQDGFNFAVDSGSTCLTLDLPAGMDVLVGANRIAVSSPFNISSLAACESGLSIGDITVSENDGTASVPVNLPTASSVLVSANFQTINGTASAGLDYTSTSGTVAFSPGETSKLINIDILQDAEIEGAENFTVELSSSVNSLITDDTAVITIEDDEDSACGKPLIDSAVDREIFIWKDCSNNIWRVRGYAGGGSELNYAGDLRTTASFSNVAPVSIEAADLLDSNDPKQINFNMLMANVWVDGFNFEVTPGTTCMTLSAPQGQTILVGANRVAVQSPFNIDTLGQCTLPGNNAPVLDNPGNQISVVNASVNLTLSATDADGDSLTYSATGLPQGLSIDSLSGVITGAGNTVGVSNVEVSVSDGTATDSKSFTWTIDSLPNQAPFVEAGNNQSIVLPSTAALSGTASDDGLPNPPGSLTVTWSKISGPGTVSFANANALNTTVSFSSDGNYLLRLTASDGSLNTADDVAITVGPVANVAPNVDAGVNQSIVLPSTAALSGTASDDGLPNPPGSLTTTWSKVSGPGTVSFANANALNTTVSFSSDGNYLLRLTASDGSLSSTDDVAITVGPVPNVAPNVDAGVNQSIVLPSTAALSGTASDDGLPNPPGALTTTWSKVSGPGTVSFANTNALSTTAGFSVDGDYVLRLTVNDGGLSSADDVAITVGPVANVAPNVNAGVNQNIVLPSSAALSGTASDDGLPNPPGALTTTWSKVSGPGTVNFADANALSTTADFSVDGDYVLRLTGSDSSLSTTDDVTISVGPVPNVAPNVNAGTNQSIELPSTATLSGTASDDGLPNPPGALTVTWSKVSGPGTVSFANANALNTSASFSIDGDYVLRLTVSDGSLSNTDDVTITVSPALNNIVIHAGKTGSGYNLSNGSQLSLTRNRLLDSSNFGPAGVVDVESLTIRDSVATLTPADLQGVDILFDGWVVGTAWSSQELQTIQDWVNNGGVLVSTNDASDYGRLATLFGSSINDSATASWTPVVSSHPIVAGPFGSWSNVSAAGSFSGLSVPTGYQMIAREGNGRGSVVVGQVGSGHVILIADEGVMRTDTDDNRRFSLNLFAYAIDAAITDIPPPVACIGADFENGFSNWVNTSASTCNTGSFVNGTPNQIIDNNVVTQVGGDHTTGGGKALYTAFNSSVGVDDVDNGECGVRSPDYNVTENSQLSIWYFHGQRDQGDDAGDYFQLEYRINGGNWTNMVSIGDVTTNASWTEATTNIPAGSTVRVRARVSDGSSTGDLVEAGIDDLQICPQ